MSKGRRFSSAPIPEAVLRAWLVEHRLTMRGLARALCREPSLLSKVMRGQVKSGPIWQEIHAYMHNPKDYPRRLATQVARARAVLRRRGLLA